LKFAIRDNNGSGGYSWTSYDTTCVRTNIDSGGTLFSIGGGGGYISEIDVGCSVATKITIFDTAGNRAHAGDCLDPVLWSYYNDPLGSTEGTGGDTNALKIWNAKAGSYIPYTKGVQITTSAAVEYIRINLRDNNGSGGH
jgi:hypothetical protein